MTDGGPAPAPELELGTRRRGGSSSPTTQELLRGVAGGLLAAFAELVEQLLAEGEEGAAVSVTVTALTRLRSRAPRRPPEWEVRLDPRRSAVCNRCPELARCVGRRRWLQLALVPAELWGLRCSLPAPDPTWRPGRRDVAGLGLEDLTRAFPALAQLCTDLRPQAEAPPL